MSRYFLGCDRNERLRQSSQEYGKKASEKGEFPIEDLDCRGIEMIFKKKPPTVLSVCLCFFAFSFMGVFAQKRDDAHEVKLTVVAEFDAFRKGDSNILSVKLQNNSKRECSLYYLPKLMLKRALDERTDDSREIFYALADLSEESAFRKRTFVRRRGSLEFTVDLASQKWNVESQSIEANVGSFQFLEKGKYLLWVEMSCDSKKTGEEKTKFVKSNRITVPVN